MEWQAKQQLTKTSTSCSQQPFWDLPSHEHLGKSCAPKIFSKTASSYVTAVIRVFKSPPDHGDWWIWFWSLSTVLLLILSHSWYILRQVSYSAQCHLSQCLSCRWWPTCRRRYVWHWSKSAACDSERQRSYNVAPWIALDAPNLFVCDWFALPSSWQPHEWPIGSPDFYNQCF